MQDAHRLPPTPPTVLMNQATTPGSVGDLTVYIIEDKEGYRNTVKELLDDTEGMHCLHTFECCEDYLTVFRDIPTPSVILMDIRIPGKMSGIDGVRRIHELNPDIYVVMLTSYQTHEDIFESLCAGARGYVVKDVDPEDIVAAIRQTAKGGLYMTRQVAQRVLSIFQRFKPSNNDYNLSKREKEVLKELVEGKRKREIAGDLCISTATVDSHVQKIYSKLHVHSNTQAVRIAIEQRLV